MGRTFLTCFPPLLFHLQENSFHFTVDHDQAALFSSLEYDFQELQKSISGDDSLSLLWCKEALVLLKRMHSEFLVLVFHRLNVSISWNDDDGVSTMFLDEYMNESLQILELCNLLKSATSEMNRYCLQIDIAMRNKCSKEYLDEIQTRGRVRKVQNRVNARHVDGGSSSTVYSKSSFRNGGAAGDNFIGAMRGAMRVLSSILASVFLHPVSVKPNENQVNCEFPQMKSFLDSVQDLARRFNEKHGISGGKSFLHSVEYELVEEAIRDAKTQLIKQHEEEEEEEVEQKLERSKALIQKKSTALKVGLEGFESEITKVFEEVLKGRNKLLQQITSRKT